MDQKYRLYIDESGTHRYSESADVKERYLCLLGLMLSSEQNETIVTPRWDELRQIFTTDTDFPSIFHYVDVISGKGDFGRLSNPEIRDEFNEKYLALINDAEFMVCAVVIDKKAHLERYGTSAMHPYHYCLNVLLERYVNHLSSIDATGDVIAEARGSKEDNQLRSAFTSFYENGSSFCPEQMVQKRLSSKKLKIKTKEARIAGLELADMLATPMKYLTLKKYGRITSLSENFTKEVLTAVFPKVRKNPRTGSTQGFGIKLI